MILTNAICCPGVGWASGCNSIRLKRREFITLLGGATAWSIAAQAQEHGKIRSVGVLMNSVTTDTEYQSRLAAFVQGLRQLGWTEGQNLRLDVRWSASDARLARAYAAELIRLMPDVILAATTLNLTVMQQATSTMPVVFVQVADPVKQGFVASLRKPGGNLTGFSLFEFSLGGKWLGLLKDVVPGLARVAVMFNPETSPQTKFFMSAIEAEAPSLGVQVIPLPVKSFAEIEPALANLSAQSNIGLIPLPDIFLDMNAPQIAELVSRYRVPTIGNIARGWKNDVLMIYGNDVKLIDQFRQSASYIDRILKGAKPSDLPIQGADNFVLIVNRKAAKMLGLTVPERLLGTADEVIE